MADIKPGDEVRVFETYQGEIRSPEDGWPGRVVKVSRALVTIRYGEPIYSDTVFRIDTGYLNTPQRPADIDTGIRIYFLTAKQIQARIEAAIGVLAGAGIECHRIGVRLAVSLEDAEKLASLFLAAKEG